MPYVALSDNPDTDSNSSDARGLQALAPALEYVPLGHTVQIVAA